MKTVETAVPQPAEAVARADPYGSGGALGGPGGALRQRKYKIVGQAVFHSEQTLVITAITAAADADQSIAGSRPDRVPGAQQGANRCGSGNSLERAEGELAVSLDRQA